MATDPSAARLGHGPVPWRSLDGEGEKVERLLCHLLHRRHPTGRRRRSESGDGGIDFHYQSQTEGHVIFQIKSFCTGLGTGDTRRKQIRDSMARAKAENPHLKRWTLVTPMDPSAKEEKWFEKQAKKYSGDFECIWESVAFCDDLASHDPAVVEYHLHGGRDAYREAVEDLSRLATDAPATPSGAVPTVQALIETLNKLSTHYRFDIATRPGHDPTAVSEWVRGLPHDYAIAQIIGVSDELAVVITATPLYAQAVEDEPIHLELADLDYNEVVAAETGALPGQPIQFAATVTSGLPSDTPVSTEGTVVLRPIPVPITDRRLRITAISPDEKTLGQVFLDAGVQTSGLTTTTVVWSAASNFFSVTVHTTSKQDPPAVTVRLATPTSPTTATTARHVARVLLHTIDNDAKLMLTDGHRPPAELPDIGSLCSDGEPWLRAIVALAALSEGLGIDLELPPANVCACDATTLTELTQFVRGTPTRLPTNFRYAICLHEHAEPAETFDNHSIIPMIEPYRPEFHVLNEPLEFGVAHIHLIGFIATEGPPHEQDDGHEGHRVVTFEPGSDAQAYRHFGPASGCTWDPASPDLSES